MTYIYAHVKFSKALQKTVRNPLNNNECNNCYKISVWYKSDLLIWPVLNSCSCEFAVPSTFLAVTHTLIWASSVYSARFMMACSFSLSLKFTLLLYKKFCYLLSLSELTVIHDIVYLNSLQLPDIDDQRLASTVCIICNSMVASLSYPVKSCQCRV